MQLFSHCLVLAVSPVPVALPAAHSIVSSEHNNDPKHRDSRLHRHSSRRQQVDKVFLCAFPYRFLKVSNLVATMPGGNG
jgi:hypothetical protein